MRGDTKKTPVVAIVQRRGMVIAKAVPEVDSYTVTRLIKKHVTPGNTVYTDELSSYNKVRYLRGEDGIPLHYRHRRIKHSSGVYVKGDIHTNTVEGLWSHYLEWYSRRVSFSVTRLFTDIPRRIHFPV